MQGCNVGDCENEADLKYVWAWGEEGTCCLAHRGELESKAGQLGRSIAFADLRTNPNARTVPPSTADELARALQRVDELEQHTKALELENEQLRAAIAEHAATVRRLAHGTTEAPPAEIKGDEYPFGGG